MFSLISNLINLVISIILFISTIQRFRQIAPTSESITIGVINKTVKRKVNLFYDGEEEKIIGYLWWLGNLDGRDGLADAALNNDGSVTGEADESFRQDRKVRFGTAVQLEEYSLLQNRLEIEQYTGGYRPSDLYILSCRIMKSLNQVSSVD